MKFELKSPYRQKCKGFFSLDSIVYLVFRKGDEWIDGFIWGFASAIWLGFLLYPIIYEVTHWKLNK